MKDYRQIKGLVTSEKDNFYRAYDKGYKQGKADGFADGYSLGYKQGFEAAHTEVGT